MKMLHWIYRRCCAGLITLALCAAVLTGCGSAARIKSRNEQSSVAQAEKEAADEPRASDPYWLIKVSDTKNFSYAIPNGNGGTIYMTATLHFIAWKKGGEEMFGQYEGRALVALNMDLSQVGAGGISYAGGVMDDSFSDNISFELIPAQQEAVTAKSEDIDLAPLAKFTGQAEIITEEYTISQQNWKALADGQVKLDVNGSFGDGSKNSQGLSLKAGENSILVSVGDLTAAYQLEAFLGTITKGNIPPDALSWFRDKVMSRMEERLSLSEQSVN